MSLSEMNSSLFVRVILAMGAHDWTSHSSFGLWSGRSESNHIEILSRLRSKRKSSGFKIALHPFEDCCSNFVFELPSFRVAVTTSIDNLAPFDVAPRLPWLELEDHWHLRTSQSTELGSASVSSSSEVAPVGASSSSWFLSIPPTSIKAALVVGSGSVERLQDIRGPRTGCFSVLQRALPLDRCSSVLSCCAASSWHALGSACASQSHLVPSNQSEVRPDTLPATCILKSCLHALAFLVSSIQWITLSSHKAVCLGLLHRCWPIACPSVSKTKLLQLQAPLMRGPSGTSKSQSRSFHLSLIHCRSPSVRLQLWAQDPSWLTTWKLSLSICSSFRCLWPAPASRPSQLLQLVVGTQRQTFQHHPWVQRNAFLPEVSFQCHPSWTVVNLAKISSACLRLHPKYFSAQMPSHILVAQAIVCRAAVSVLDLQHVGLKDELQASPRPRQTSRKQLSAVLTHTKTGRSLSGCDCCHKGFRSIDGHRRTCFCGVHDFPSNLHLNVSKIHLCSTWSSTCYCQVLPWEGLEAPLKPVSSPSSILLQASRPLEAARRSAGSPLEGPLKAPWSPCKSFFGHDAQKLFILFFNITKQSIVVWILQFGPASFRLVSYSHCSMYCKMNTTIGS